MKNWNTPEMLELAIECTSRTTAQTNNKHYKTKTQQCECGHNTNFAFDMDCSCGGYGDKVETGADTVIPDE